MKREQGEFGMAKPVLIARAKVSGREPPRWVTIGAGFRAQFDSGPGISVQLQSIPFNFDGNFILMPPRDDDVDQETGEIP
jgi:hypothetical protein